MTDTPHPRDNFGRRAAAVLDLPYGEGEARWKHRWAYALGLNIATVKRWCQGTTEIPGYAWTALETLEALHGADAPLPPRWVEATR